MFHEQTEESLRKEFRGGEKASLQNLFLLDYAGKLGKGGGAFLKYGSTSGTLYAI